MHLAARVHAEFSARLAGTGWLLFGAAEFLNFERPFSTTPPAWAFDTPDWAFDTRIQTTQMAAGQKPRQVSAITW